MISNGQIIPILNNTACSDPRSVAVDLEFQTLTAACFGNGVIRVYISSFLSGAQTTAMAAGSNSSVVMVSSNDAGVCRGPLSVDYDRVTHVTFVACNSISSIGGGVFAFSHSNPTDLITLGSGTDCSGAHGVTVDSNSGDVFAACLTTFSLFISGNVIRFASSNQITLFSGGTLTKDFQRWNFNKETGALLLVSPEQGILTTNGPVRPLVPLGSTACLLPVNVWSGFDPIAGRAVTYVLCGSHSTDDAVVSVADNGTITSLFPIPRSVNFICGQGSAMDILQSTGEIFFGCNGSPYALTSPVGLRVSRSGSSIPLLLRGECPLVGDVKVHQASGTSWWACTYKDKVIKFDSENVESYSPAFGSPSRLIVHQQTGTVYVTAGYNSALDPGGLAVVSPDASTVSWLLPYSECAGLNSIQLDEQRMELYATCSTQRGDGAVSILKLILSSDGMRRISSSRVQLADNCIAASVVVFDPMTSSYAASCGGTGVTAWSDRFRCWSGFYWSRGACQRCDPGLSRPWESTQSNSKNFQLSCRACTSGSISMYAGVSKCTIVPQEQWIATMRAFSANLVPSRTKLARQHALRQFQAATFRARAQPAHLFVLLGRTVTKPRHRSAHHAHRPRARKLGSIVVRNMHGRALR
jgi:hypothetical protein